MSNEFKIIVNLEDLCSWVPTSNMFSKPFNDWKSRADSRLRLRLMDEGLRELISFARGENLEDAGKLESLFRGTFAPVRDEFKKAIGLIEDEAHRKELIDTIYATWPEPETEAKPETKPKRDQALDKLRDKLKNEEAKAAVDQLKTFGDPWPAVSALADKLKDEDVRVRFEALWRKTSPRSFLESQRAALSKLVEPLDKSRADKIAAWEVESTYKRLEKEIAHLPRDVEDQVHDAFHDNEDSILPIGFVRSLLEGIDSPEVKLALEECQGLPEHLQTVITDYASQPAAKKVVAAAKDLQEIVKNGVDLERHKKVGYPYWRGGLIQFGTPRMRSIEGKEYDGEFLPENDAVVLYRQNQRVGGFGKKRVQQGLWINIYPAGEKDRKGKLQRGVPLSPGELGTTLKFGGGKNDLLKSIHKHTAPYRGGITFWTDVGSGWNVAVRQIAHKMDRANQFGEIEKYGTHNQYAFTLDAGQYETDVYTLEGGEWKQLTGDRDTLTRLGIADIFDEVDRIVISSTKEESYGHYHGTHIDPPRGG